MFRQQNLVAKDKFEVFANGLVSAFTLTKNNTGFTSSLQYNIGNVYGATFHGDKLRELPDPIPCKDETIPDPDSIPLSILSHPLGKRHEKDISAYNPPEVTYSPTEEGDPLSVLHLSSSFATLNRK